VTYTPGNVARVYNRYWISRHSYFHWLYCDTDCTVTLAVLWHWLYCDTGCTVTLAVLWHWLYFTAILSSAPFEMLILWNYTDSYYYHVCEHLEFMYNIPPRWLIYQYCKIIVPFFMHFCRCMPDT
jgi:acyl-CoA synthetase (AMP-forming)/AMP-acid ligase II